MLEVPSPGLIRPWMKQGLFLAVFLGGLVAAYLAFSVWDYVRNQDTASQDQTEWVISQLEVEHLKLDRALRQAQSGTTRDLDNLRKRFDILYSRTEIVATSAIDPAMRPDINRLQRMLDDQVALIDGPDAELAAGLAQLDQMVASTADIPRAIALASISVTALRHEEERRRIVTLIELTIGVVMLVTLALCMAVLKLFRQTVWLNKASRQTEESSQRLSAMLRGSLDGIVVTDDHARILDFSGSATDVFGFSQQEAIGANLIDLLFPEPRRAVMRSMVERFRETGETEIAETGGRETEMLHKAGHVFPTEMSVSMAQTQNGPIFISYFRDMTDTKAKEAEIIETRDEALAIYKEKSRFFAMMSHEMRTPMNGVLSALQLLDDSPLDPEHKGFVAAAMTSGDILLSHINDVLAIERSESDTEEQRQSPCDLVALASGLIDTMEPLAQASQVELHLKQVGLRGHPLMTDPRAIQQILVNLLSNAIKFSPEGDVTLSMQYHPSNSEALPGHLRLEVSDTGIGIPSDDLGRIFEDFVSLDSRYERRTGGTGLGLGIVSRFVKRLDGTVSCISEPGEGTSFVVEMPMFEAGNTLPDTEIGNERQPLDTTPKKLLVVDDNDINRDLLAVILQRMGHDVTIAPGGQEAIDLAGQSRFDAILMDISMPVVSGTQATRAIQSAPGPNRHTPIIAVTAHALPHEREGFRAAGMTGFLLKPVDQAALRRIISGLSNGEETPDAPKAPSIQRELGGKPVLNETQVAELFQLLGRDKLVERFSVFTQQATDEIARLQETEKTDQLQARAHALAGMCGIFGAEHLHGLLKDIETACKSGEGDQAKALVALVPGSWAAAHQAWETTLS